MQELKDKLKTEVEEADWDLLRVHHENGAVFVTKGNLDLLDVAVAIAQDKVQFVKVWLDNGDIARPTDDEVSLFEKEPYKKICKFIIVQPYVIIKLLDEGEGLS